MAPPPSPTTYTSIPLPTGDVISRSIHNLTSAISRHRPWSELVCSGDFSFPCQLSSLYHRSKTNYRYFLTNYAMVVSACAAFALITVGLVAVIVVGIVIALGLVLHYFREDPLILWGFQLGDKTVAVFLFLLSVWALWFTGSLLSLEIGVALGLLLCTIHSLLRNSHGLFLDQDDAVSGGLIAR